MSRPYWQGNTLMTVTQECLMTHRESGTDFRFKKGDEVAYVGARVFDGVFCRIFRFLEDDYICDYLQPEDLFEPIRVGGTNG